MRDVESPLTQERLKQLLHYDPETGVFTWRMRPPGRAGGGGKIVVGARAGGIAGDGYWVIGLGGRRYRAGRLAWFYVHGVWPEGDIDHKNVDHLDDRLDNLRPATRSQNLANKPKSSRNKTGFKGVSLYPKTGKYVSYASFKGRTVYCGYFDTPEEAHAAFVKKSQELHGEFARAA